MCGGKNGLIGGLIKSVVDVVGLNQAQQSAAPAQAQAPAQQQAMADTQAAQSSNAKLAERNRRRGASLLATGAGTTGLVQSAGGKTSLGA